MASASPRNCDLTIEPRPASAHPLQRIVPAPTRSRIVAAPAEGDATRPAITRISSRSGACCRHPRQGLVDHRLDLQLIDLVPPGRHARRNTSPAAAAARPAREAEEENEVRTPLIRYLDGLDAYLALSRASPAVEVLHLPHARRFRRGRAGAVERLWSLSIPTGSTE